MLDNNVLETPCGVLESNKISYLEATNNFVLNGSVDLSESGILLNTNSVQVPQISIPSLLPVKGNNSEMFVVNDLADLQSLQSATATTTSPIYVVSMTVRSPQKNVPTVMSNGLTAELLQKCNQYSTEVARPSENEAEKKENTGNNISRSPPTSTPLNSEACPPAQLDISMIHQEPEKKTGGI